jgi:hypothetical protein
MGMLVWLLLMILALVALHGQSRLPFYLILFLISFSLSWKSISGIKGYSVSELVIAHFSGASFVSLRQGSSVDHYCWYNDSISMGYLETYRQREWNRRKYDIRLHEGESLESFSAGASSCHKLEEGIWLLCAEGIRVLVIRGPGLKEVPGIFFEEELPEFRLRPDLILLSGEAQVNAMQLSQSFEEVTLVLDGSSREWYRRRLYSGYRHIYSTDLDGAYVKRW